MCVRLVDDFINVKTETKKLICCEEIPTFAGKLRFYWGYKCYHAVARSPFERQAQDTGLLVCREKSLLQEFSVSIYEISSRIISSI